jgi:hypothetical protein
MSSPPDRQLEIALAAYAAALPRQARLIQLAGEVLRHLAVVKASLPSPPEVNLQEAATNIANGKQALTALPIPEPIFRNSLSRLLALCRQFDLLPRLSPDLSRSLMKLSPKAWLGEQPGLEEIFAGRDVPGGLLFFLGQKALVPFYQQAAEPYYPLFSQGDWHSSRCPACGKEPALACLAQKSGQRLLYCSLCATQWSFSPKGCVFCGSGSEQQFSYVFTEEDPARRADFCRACRRYLKTVIAGCLKHLVYLPLEEFVTVDLDVLLAQNDFVTP